MSASNDNRPMRMDIRVLVPNIPNTMPQTARDTLIANGRMIPALRADAPLVDEHGEAFEPWASIRLAASSAARQLGPAFPSDAGDELLSIVALQVVERFYSDTRPGGPMFSRGGWPAAEDEDFFTDEAIEAACPDSGERAHDRDDVEAVRFARRCMKRAIVDVLGGVRRRGERGGVERARDHVPYVDSPDECEDENGEPTGAAFVGPTCLTTSEDAMIAAIDAMRGPKPLTAFERAVFWSDVPAEALARLRRLYGRALQPAPRVLSRVEAAWCAALKMPGLWDARTALPCVLELLASGHRPEIEITSETIFDDLVACELPSMERALGRARARNRLARPTGDAVAVDYRVRQAG